MSPSSEILVHISAPSRASDDARYRRELQGFLDFQPEKRYVLTAGPSGQGSQSDGFGAALSQVADASFTSSSNPTSVPSKALLKSAIKTLVTPASAVFNSSRKLVSKTPALVPGTTSHKPLHRTCTLTSPQRRPRTAPDGSSGSFGIQETPLLQRAQSDSSKTPPSVIPDSQPTPYYLKRPQLQSSSPSPTRSSSPTTRRKRQRLESPPALPQYEIADEDGEEEPTSSVPHQPPPASSSYGADAEASSTPVPPLQSPRFAPTSLQIRAPRAPTGDAHYITHKTDALANLSQRMPIEKYYIPQIVSQTRLLAPSERGYWRVDISSYPEKSKSEFWGYLEQFVANGDAGWGVSCGLVTSDGLEEGNGAVDVQDMTVARVYCWGEIVGEIWNVLFLFSNRRVKGSGACWVDAWEKVVVRMK